MNELTNKLVQFKQNVCLHSGDNSWTYAELLDKVNNLKYELSEGHQITSGQVVGLIGDYSFESISYFLALLDNGNIIIPITNTIQAEINSRVKTGQADWIINLRQNSVIRADSSPEKHSLMSDLILKGDAGLILFSSGSTGEPKAMVHNLTTLLMSYLDRRPKRMTFLVFLMFDHIGGLNTLLNCLSMGATIVIPQERTAEHIGELIEKKGVNVFPTSPTFLNMMLMADVHEKYDVRSLRLITYGTEPMPESLLTHLKEAFGRVKFLQTFGTSETGIIKTSSKSSESTLIKFEDDSQEFRIVNGELWIRSQTQILGYINYSMSNFTEDGWFKTGDLVKQAEGGYLRIIGRIKEIINVGGQKVLPSEVESVLLEIPEVSDCIVFGKPNSITGQMVAANITTESDLKPAELKKIIKTYCRSRLDPYKLPLKINIVGSINMGDRFKKKRIL
jgi:acyl-coenzyme A synthetase/AMP-(fatty) acid ligase